MTKSIRLRRTAVLALLASLMAPTTASAHVTYSNRDFGSFIGDGSDAPVTISGQTVSGNFGWADATDADFGDSHRLRAFRFSLSHAAAVILSVTGIATGYPGIPGDPGLYPAFSIYSGLAHVAPATADHDSSSGSLAHLNATYGPAHGKEGALIALGDWAIGNDDNELSHFTYWGHAADGTSANFGSAPGIVGDGAADHFVTQTFSLPAGDYSIFIGGALYGSHGPVALGVNSTNGSSYATYAFTPTLTVVPEPSTLALLGMSCSLWALRRVPKRKARPLQVGHSCSGGQKRKYQY